MTTTPHRPVHFVRDHFEGRPEARTSYANQRGLAARDLGGDTLCIHKAKLVDGCRMCRASNAVLLPVDGE